MKLLPAALLSFLVLAAAAQAQDVTITDEHHVTDRVVELTVATPAFVAPAKVQVDLPVGYDADPARRWPVTYVLAGTQNRYTAFNRIIHGEKLTTGYPSIVVAPDPNSGYWSDWYNGGAFGPPMYETWVIDQLIPLIDAHFRTLPGRAHRAVFGISMGGYGAMMFAARHPDLFAAAATLSGAVDSNLAANGAVLSASSSLDGAAPDAIYGPRATQEVRWRGHNPWDLAANLRGMDLQVRTADAIPNPGIGENPASADGVSCVVEGGVYMASTSFHQQLDALKVNHLWKDYGPGCHTPANFTRETIDTLAVFQRVLADPPAPPKVVDYRSIEPHFDVFGWSVDTDPARALEFLHLRAGRGGVTLEGSGKTTVTTPPWYRGLHTVDVAGRPTALLPDGRLRFVADLGPAHTVQQYTPGAATTFTTRRVALAPHAVVRITRMQHVARGLRVCASARGGTVRGAKLAARRSRATLDVGRRPRCVVLPGVRGASTVRLRGADRFGHPVRARRHVSH